MGTFAERCPYCETKIDVYDHFISHDYASNFEIDCPSCEETIEVDVHAVPEFEMSRTTEHEAVSAPDSNPPSTDGE